MKKIFIIGLILCSISTFGQTPKLFRDTAFNNYIFIPADGTKAISAIRYADINKSPYADMDLFPTMSISKDSGWVRNSFHLSQFGIHANMGVPVGAKIQHLIDSAFTLPGITYILFDESGIYCTSDHNLWFNYTLPRRGIAVMNILPGRDVYIGYCEDKPKKAF